MHLEVLVVERDYVRAMERRGLTAETIYSRRGEIRRWLEWLEGEGIDWRDATRATVERWADGHAELAPRTRYCKLSHVGNLILLQRVMGHASITSTQIYTEIDAEAAVAAARRLTA